MKQVLEQEERKVETDTMPKLAKILTIAVAALAVAGGSAHAMSAEEEHFEALASQLGNASDIQIDLEPLLDGKW